MRRLVLTYHAIDNSGSVLAVTPDAFARQVSALHSAGYEFRTISSMLSSRSHAKEVALSFDDGFASVLLAALPILAQVGAPATVFPIVAGLDRTARWTRGVHPLIEARMLDAAGLRALVTAGWEVGAHGWTHTCLLTLGPDAARTELSECRSFLEDVAGTQIEGFAYPQGCWTRESVQLVRSLGYSWACSTLPGWPTRSWHRWLIPRVTIGSTTTTPRFWAARVAPLQCARLALPGPDGLWHLGHRHGPHLCSTVFS